MEGSRGRGQPRGGPGNRPQHREDFGTSRGGQAHGKRSHDLTSTGATATGPRAFAEAGLRPSDIDYASIYDSFTITVVVTLEDLGFCEKGEGGRFVLDGALVAPFGKLPFNTDGGGLCNNHPSNRGGMTKIIEAIRQLRGEAHPAVQVPDCELALAHGTGGSIGTRMGSATLILGRADALMTASLPVPSPERTPETEAFWSATAEGRLLLSHCDECGAVIWYPRQLCPACGATSVSWVAASGDGIVYSFTVVYRARGPIATSCPTSSPMWDGRRAAPADQHHRVRARAGIHRPARARAVLRHWRGQRAVSLRADSPAMTPGPLSVPRPCPNGYPPGEE